MTDFLTRQGASNPTTATFQVLGIGLGTTAPGGGGLHVGATGLLRIDTSGNLTRVNNVPYSWPASQGSAGQMLTNDGSGNLTWTTPAGGLSGSGIASRVAYWSGASALTANTNFVWDNTNGRLAVGNAAPLTTLDITGHVSLTNTGTASELRLYEPSGSGANYTAFKAQAQAGDVTYTLPVDAGTNGYLLSTNGTGTLSWIAPPVTGANTALSNLAAVAVNADLDPGSDNARELGTSALRWAEMWIRQINVRNNTLDTLTLTATAISADLDLTITSPSSLAITATGGGGTLYLTAAAQTFLTTPQVTLFDTAAASLTLDTSRAAAGAGVTFDIFGSGAQLGGTDLAGGEVRIHSGVSTGTGSSQITFRTPTPGLTGTADNTYSTKMLIDGVGNVVIGDGTDRMRWDNTNTTLQVGGTTYGIGPAILITPSSIFSQNGLGNVGVMQILGDPVAVQTTSGTVFEATVDKAIEVFGSTAAVSSAGAGRIRYDSGTNKLQISNNGGAYADIGTGSGMAIGNTVTSGTTGSVLFVGAASALAQDNANFFWDDTNNQLLTGLGSASNPSRAFVGDPNTGDYSTAADEYAISAGGNERIRARATATTAQGRIELSVGTLSAPEYGVYGTGTFLAASATLQRMFRFTATGAGSGAGEQVALLGQIAAGYTGAARTIGAWGLNNIGAGATAGSTASDFSAFIGQYGVMGRSDGAGSGVNVGLVGDAENNTSKNFGVYGRAVGSGASAWQIGVVGIAQGAGGTDVRLGGYFSAASSINYPTISASTRAAILADNEGSGFPLFQGNDSGTLKMLIESSGILRIRADGTAAAPLITYGAASSDTDTGQFHPADNTLAWATAGTEAMRIGPTGEVSIGNGITAGSNQMLDVERNTNAEVMIQITNTTSGTAAATTLQVVGNDAGGGTKALRLMEVSPGNTNAGFTHAAGHSLLHANNIAGHNLYLQASSTTGNLIFIAGGNTESGRFTSTGEFGVGATPASNTMIQATRTTNAAVTVGVTNAQSGTAGSAALSATSNAGAVLLTAYSSAFTTSESAIASAGRLESSSGLTAGLVLSVRATNAPILFYSNQSGTGTEKARMFGTGNWSFGGTSDQGQVTIDNGATAESILVLRDNATTVWTLTDGGRVTHAPGTLSTGQNAHSLTVTMPNSATAETGVLYTVTGSGNTTGIQTAAQFTLGAGTGTPTASLAVGGSTVMAGTGTDPFASTAPANFGGFYTASGTTAGSNVGLLGRAFSSTGKNYGLIGYTQAASAVTAIGVTGFTFGNLGTQVGGLFALGSARTNAAVTPTVSAALIADNGDTTSPIMLLRDANVTVWTVADGGNMTMNGDFDLVPGTDNTGEIGTDALRWNRVRANNVVTGDLDLKDDAKGAHWKIIEEVDSITVVNVKTGKRFKMNLTPIED